MTKSIDLKKGQRWLVKFPNALQLSLIEVLIARQKAVKLVEVRPYESGKWFEIEDLKWVERYD